jgi:hypothetical protein
MEWEVFSLKQVFEPSGTERFRVNNGNGHKPEGMGE